MPQLYVYEPWPDAVDTLGLCGPLLAAKATFSTEKNGEMELAIEHPIDPAGKWAFLEQGNLIRADVPMRSTPLIARGMVAYMVNPTRYVVKTGLSRAARSVYTSHAYSPITTQVRLTVLEPATPAVVFVTIFDWSEIEWANGRGWILTASLESSGAFTTDGSRASAEVVFPSPRSRTQFFRIYGISMTDKGVQAKARHVSYDIMGAQTTYAAGNVTCDTALSGLFLNAWWGEIKKHADIYRFTNIPTAADISGWTRSGQIEALLAPSNSVASYWNASILRDNWTFTIINDPEYNSGFSVEYGKNLLGIKCETDMTDVQSALIPVGQTVKGKPLTVPTGTYTVDGASVTVTDGIVRSTNDVYPIPHVGVLDLGDSVKATGTGGTALNAAYVKLIRAALAKFSDEQCDLPQVTLSVDFLMLGDTAEYAQYRNLDKLFLYDLVRVTHPRLGIDVTVQVNKIEWDCLLGRYESIELGTLRKDYARTRIASWQMPGISSMRSMLDVVEARVTALGG